MIGRQSEAGFTLVELMVSLLIFGMLSAAGVALLSFSVRAQESAEERLGDLAGIRRLGALLTSDLAQAAPRPFRDEAGRTRPAFAGTSGDGSEPVLRFVRGGWENHDGSGRSALQKVEYRLRNGRLERVAFRHVDGGAATAPAALVEDLRSLRLRYRDNDGAWRDRWDPTRVTALPRAVEIVLETDGGAPIRHVFLTGTRA